MTAEFTNVRAEIKAEGETTRRHFDVMVEQVKDVVKVPPSLAGLESVSSSFGGQAVADGTVRNTERLDDHENRIKAIEGPAAHRRPQ